MCAGGAGGGGLFGGGVPASWEAARPAPALLLRPTQAGTLAPTSRAGRPRQPQGAPLYYPRALFLDVSGATGGARARGFRSAGGALPERRRLPRARKGGCSPRLRNPIQPPGVSFSPDAPAAGGGGGGAAAAAAAAAGLWGGGVDVHRAGPVPKSAFTQQLEVQARLDYDQGGAHRGPARAEATPAWRVACLGPDLQGASPTPLLLLLPPPSPPPAPHRDRGHAGAAPGGAGGRRASAGRARGRGPRRLGLGQRRRRRRRWGRRRRRGALLDGFFEGAPPPPQRAGAARRVARRPGV
jgi:hypothetical protein